MKSSVLISAAPEFSALPKNYLFTEVRKKTEEFLLKNGGEIINLGVGDIAYPISRKAAEAFSAAALEMGDNVRFRGYPPEGGYPFLKEAICGYYRSYGVKIGCDEIFAGDGSKSDISSFADVFAKTEVLITDPVYPVYADASLLGGNRIRFISGSKQNEFLPSPAGVKRKPYIIYLCSPNNPSGGAYGYGGLKEWVDFALDTGSVILFDAAYSAFAGEDIPKSVFEIEGARGCCAEFCSFSKFAGFTGVRCSWVAVPSELKCGKSKVSDLWRRRQSTKFNGVSYPVQRAAEAALTAEGAEECRAFTEIYRENAASVSAFFGERGIWHTGGEHSPYVWAECPENFTSFEFFGRLLDTCRIVCTPGSGFGKAGEGFFRISCFARRETVKEALKRFAGCPYFG